MRNALFFIVTILACMQASAQKVFKKNTLYVEILGNGVVLSANYERQMGNKPGLGFHMGVGLGGDGPAIPLGAKYLFQLGNQKSFIETGVGVTLAERDLLDDKNNDLGDHSPYKAAFIPSIGYRHQTKYGLMWRVNYTPIFSAYRNILSFGGISIGWSI